MSKVKIITDSNSGLSQAEGEKLGVYIIPMPFTINGEEYLEEINMTQEKFYELLAQNAEVKTSQPSQIYLEELWDKLLKEYDELVYIPMSSGLSATCENAKEYAKKYSGKVYVVDNLRISITQKESVYEAVEMLKRGKTAQEIKDYLEYSKNKQSIYITMGLLKYLKRGGRISPTAALIGDILGVKPILYSRGEKFEKFAIALSMGQAKKKMIQKIKLELETEFKDDYNNGKMVVYIAHTQNMNEALKFKEQIQKELPNLTFRSIDALSLSVSCHIGPGALAIAVCANNFIN